MTAVKKIPQRKCIGCNQMKNKKELIRILKTQDDEIVIDTTGKKIFENDMVQYKIMIPDGHGKSELKEVIGRVKWMEERLGFGVPQIINNKNYDDFRECTVVGNYFDERFFGGRELIFI